MKTENFKEINLMDVILTMSVIGSLGSTIFKLTVYVNVISHLK